MKATYSYRNALAKTFLLQLVNNALALAKQVDCGVFNALDVMQNEPFLKGLRFGPGEAVNAYLVNSYWCCGEGVIAIGGRWMQTLHYLTDS